MINILLAAIVVLGAVFLSAGREGIQVTGRIPRNQRFDAPAYQFELALRSLGAP
jgi:hypothetical protein